MADLKKPKSESTASQVDYRLKWHVMAAVGAGVFLATVDGSIINVSLPTLVRELNTDFAVVQWVVLSYLLTITSTMAGIGRLADMVGKKQIYLLGFLIFTSGSALCGLSPSVELLIAFRVVQATGAAMTMALGAAILTEAFPPKERGKAMGVIGAIVSVGIVSGPALGGLILGLLSWHWIFYVNLPVGILGAFLVQRYIPDFKPRTGQKFDVLGGVTLFSCILSVLLGLTLGQQQGFLQPTVFLLLAAGMALLILFGWVENRAVQPMIDMKLFRNPVLRVNLVSGILAFVSLGGTIILLPFYLENIMGFASIKVGLLMGILPVMLGVISPVSGALSDHISSRKITMAGLLVMLVGFMAACTLTEETSVFGYALRMLTVGAGIGLFLSPNNSSIMGAAPKHQLGIVSGMMAQSRTLGQTVGVAVVGAVWAGRTVYYAGAAAGTSATVAPVQAQVKGLHDAFFAAAVLTLFALLLNLRAYLREARGAGMAGQLKS